MASLKLNKKKSCFQYRVKSNTEVKILGVESKLNRIWIIKARKKES